MEYAPLLPPGRHYLSLTNLEVLCVDRFPSPSSRDEIFASIKLFIGDLLQENVICDIWVDGDFLTENPEPQIANLLVVFSEDSFYSLDSGTQTYLFSILDHDTYLPRLEASPIVSVARDNPTFLTVEGWLNEWANFFHKTDGNWLKGVAVIKLGENDVGIRLTT